MQDDHGGPFSLILRPAARWRSRAAAAAACLAWTLIGAPTPGQAAPAAPAAPPPDTGPDSLACQTAMKELRAQERAAASAPLPGGAPRSVNERLQAPRARAARACLGNEAPDSAAADGAPAPLVEPQPPASVGTAAAAAAARGASAATEAARAASAAASAAAPARAPRRGAAAAPPISVPPVAPALPTPTAPRAASPRVAAPPLPKTVTGCDAAGCWASDGTRLQRQGALLVGPRGACTQQGAVLACP